jgi:Lrp/AsnC family transcriptional regulator for asnA, asnC and gidA
MQHRIDHLDRDIVRLLIEDGRMSGAEIARRLGSTERVIRYRIDQLIQDGVIQVSAVVNPSAVGFPVTADVWVEVEPGQVMTVARKLMRLEEVSYVACSTGDRDVSIQVNACGIEALHSFVTEVLGNVPGVTKTRTLIVPLILKDVHDWHIPEPVSGKTHPEAAGT